MKALIIALFLSTALPGLLWPQTPPKPDSSTPAEPAAISTAAPDSNDRFQALWDEQEHLQTVFEKTRTDNMSEVDKLLRTKRCQISRIGGLIDRSMTAMEQYLDAAQKYWGMWGEAETLRIEGQKKTLALLVVDQKRTGDLLDQERKDREDLERRKANLEQGKRTEEINKEIDGLIADIRDSEARLDKAQADFDDLTKRIGNMQTSIQARVIDINQHSNRLEAWKLDYTAYFEKSRAAAQEVCNTKQPGASRTPLSKPGSKQQ